MRQRLDSSIELEPIREGFQVRLKNRYGNYLRANGGLPPWRNSVTHDIPYRHYDWILWDVETMEARPEKPLSSSLLSEMINPYLNLSSFSLRSSISGPTEGHDPPAAKKVWMMVYYTMVDDDGNVMMKSIECKSFTTPVSVATQTTPIVAWPQQQWRFPTTLQETQQRPQSAVEMDEDKEEEGGGFEIVANKISLVVAII
ncbi:unnamed protein product [Lactuca saligna]|uniref:DUF569 domain-containing protein n=1 Tax=Lactuca saligna TaxID=75948 RepID=A0AA36ELZ4_LACSI|nr:unnamed protein product [Lactuca saligna]